jgi:NitT/TauT family transport system ATP-binding protein
MYTLNRVKERSGHRGSSQGLTREASKAPSTPGESFIEVRDISKVYATRKGPIEALSTVNIDVKEGEFVSVVGPSGCGKSTLMMIVSGLTPPTSGTVTIRGTRVTKPFTDLGIVFQRDVLLDWRTVLQNVMLPCEIRKLPRPTAEDRIHELLESVGLSDFSTRYPYELSGGMRQRVALCRALVHDPPLLLMDEPFGALDALTRDQLNIDLQHLWSQSQKTVLFITHSIPEAVFLADRVIVMSAHPGVVRASMTIDLPRPRHLSIRETAPFGEYVRRVHEIFFEFGVLTERG